MSKFCIFSIDILILLVYTVSIGGAMMKSEFTFLLDDTLKSSFEMAIQLNGANKEDILEGFMRSYVANSFAQAAATYGATPLKTTTSEQADPNYGKAIHRIPKWAKKPYQLNHKIIRAYLQLAEVGPVSYYALVARCSNQEHYPDEYVPTFLSNFAQMKFDGDKSHGKVFEVSAENIVSLWPPIESTLMCYKQDFLIHTTDVGYLNRNNQRNMGRTKADGTDHMQYLYTMRCENCDHEYFANGSDIFQKKCPKCQGGADTGFLGVPEKEEERIMGYRSFPFAGGEILTEIGATWFVSFAYYEKIDKTHNNWERVKTKYSRISNYHKGAQYHRDWLVEVLSMNPDALNTNTIGLEASQTKKMAKILLENWT